MALVGCAGNWGLMPRQAEQVGGRGDERSRLACWHGVLAHQTWETVNMLGSWVGGEVGSHANMHARNMGRCCVGRAPGQHTHQKIGLGKTRLGNPSTP